MEYTGNEAKSKGKKKKKTLLGRYLGSMPGMGMRKATSFSMESFNKLDPRKMLKGKDKGKEKGKGKDKGEGEDKGSRLGSFWREHHEESNLMF